MLLLKPGSQKELYGELSKHSLTAIELPLWAGLIATFLRRKGYSVKMIDAEAERQGSSNVVDRISEINPILVGIIVSGTNPSVSTMNIVGVRAVLEEIRRRDLSVVEGMYRAPIGKGVIRKSGRDVTVVAISHLMTEAFHAAQELSNEGIDIEVIDPRTLRPLDEEMILTSVGKTGRLVIADTGWKTGGMTAEIGALVAEKSFSHLKAPIKRVACPDLPTPAGGYTLEEAFYID